jgi:hypothetical protein
MKNTEERRSTYQSNEMPISRLIPSVHSRLNSTVMMECWPYDQPPSWGIRSYRLSVTGLQYVQSITLRPSVTQETLGRRSDTVNLHIEQTGCEGVNTTWLTQDWRLDSLGSTNVRQEFSCSCCRLLAVCTDSSTCTVANPSDLWLLMIGLLRLGNVEEFTFTEWNETECGCAHLQDSQSVG